MQTGQRAEDCELSTIDTTILLAGVLAVAAFFDRETRAEREINTLTDALYNRVDWQWARNGGPTVAHCMEADEAVSISHHGIAPRRSHERLVVGDPLIRTIVCDG